MAEKSTPAPWPNEKDAYELKDVIGMFYNFVRKLLESSVFKSVPNSRHGFFSKRWNSWLDRRHTILYQNFHWHGTALAQLAARLHSVDALFISTDPCPRTP